MAPPSIGPSPCFDPACGGGHAPGERVALAASLCNARGVQLTAVRRYVLERLWENGRPMGAYELIDALERRTSRRVAPPTVYRVLEFLTAQGLVAKLESRNAYVPRIHPERRHDGLFFVCDHCGISIEREDARIEGMLAEDAAALGYRPARRIIEVGGTCRDCVEAGAA